MVDSLLEIEVACNLLKAEEGDEAKGLNPVDFHYTQLKADIRVVEKGEDTFALMRKYVETTHAETHRSYSLEILEVRFTLSLIFLVTPFDSFSISFGARQVYVSEELDRNTAFFFSLTVCFGAYKKLFRKLQRCGSLRLLSAYCLIFWLIGQTGTHWHVWDWFK